jgi:hypothetical protein
MNLNPAMPVEASISTTGAGVGRRRCPDASVGSLSGRLMQVSNDAGRFALRGLKAVLREPGRTFTLLMAMLAGVRSVSAAPSGRRLPGLPDRVGAAHAPTSMKDDPWEQAGRQIGAEVALCMRTRYIPDLDPADTEAHCIGQAAFNRAMNVPFDPDQFREGAREAPGLDSDAGRYVALVERGMHAAVTLVKPASVQQNIQNAACLAHGLPAVEHRIEDAADLIVENCNLRARVDNDALGQPGLFIRPDLDQVLQEACTEGALVPPTTRELRRANAALYFQSDRVKDERAFHLGQHRIHEGQASQAANSTFERRVVDLIGERIGI